MKWQPLFSERTARMRRSAVRELLKAANKPGMISFAGGIPAPELFPLQEAAQAAATVLAQRGRQALQYGETEGVAELRDWIAGRFSRPAYGVRRENVLIVTGSQQALDLIGKIFLDSGDHALVENPTYLAMLTAWRPFHPTLAPMPSEENTSKLASMVGPKTKLIYVVPNFQNPQGTTLGIDRRRQLLEIATGKEVAIVEDNPYGELRFDGEAAPDLLELTGGPEGCVIHLESFSKTLSPGLRVGYVIAPVEVVDKLAQAKQAADLHTSTFCQHVVLELLRNGVLERQIPLLRDEYRRRRDTMMAAIKDNFPVAAQWTRPAGGMFLLVTIPGIDAHQLLERALAENVAFVPGEHFHVDGTGRDTMRLNFSCASPEKIQEGIQRLAKVIKAAT